MAGVFRRSYLSVFFRVFAEFRLAFRRIEVVDIVCIDGFVRCSLLVYFDSADRIPNHGDVLLLSPFLSRVSSLLCRIWHNACNRMLFLFRR